MNGFDQERDELLEALSSDDLMDRIFAWERIIGILGSPLDGDLIAAANGMVDLDRPYDQAISLGEWARMYLDLAGVEPYAGDNPDVTKFIDDIRENLYASIGL